MLEKAVNMVNEESPDLVILGGDITDDFSTKAQMKEAYEILKNLKSDTYYVFGNHDCQLKSDMADGRQYTEEELVQTIENSGIKVLKDEAVKISDDMVILGREDASRPDRRKSVDELKGIDTNAFLITADHQPYEDEDIIATGADLQLSGHSHAGQVFPNHFIYWVLGLNAYGEYEVGNTKLIVSSGEALWAVPFKNEGHSEITMVTIKPEKD